MDNAHEPIEPAVKGTETAGEGSPAASSAARVGRWVKNTVYGFAGLVILALVITVVSPEVAVGLSQYLPQEYQQTLFATSGSGECCSAGIPVGGYNGCCPSTAATGSSIPSCCASGPAAVANDETLAADIPSLSLDTMLAGLSDD